MDTASRCDPHFPNPRLSFWLSALVLTMTWSFSVTESAAPIQLRGEVGGKVTFRCPVAKQRALKFVYLQRRKTFVNGYHMTKDLSVLAWKNTRMDDDNRTIHMFDLNMSHSGDYRCVIHYIGSANQIVETTIHLAVTATYSKPALTKHCSDENRNFSCQVTCASHGGYPGTEMMWNVSGTQMWKVVNSSEMSNPNTMLVSSSSTTYINCSNGGVTSLSCFVGNITSDTIRVCERGKPKDPSDYTSPYVIPAVCAVVVVSMLALLLLWWRRKKGQQSKDR
ncbi:uncharacterized protein LOC141771498 isoform X2 [Sebastes fasciatus]|uniref:uncharacterized protein LOC141771498 isoform X2 n=1 Tax=Sebastes fasciatus TaxID=394691 RepID=UPI003D9EEF5D